MNDERSTWQDAETGLTVTEWTRHPSNHLYFTNPGWFDGGRRMVFVSDRGGRHTLAVLDLADGTQRPLCDLAEGEAVNPFQAAVDAASGQVVAQIAGHYDLVDGFTGARRRLFTVPDGWHGIIPNITADGRRVCFGLTEASDLPFAERFAAHPRSRLLVHDLDTGRTDVIHERQAWLGHVNTSPADPHRFSFCHEGPWTKVEHRVWCCDLRDGRVWKVGPDLRHPACVGHEYWLADGRRIAYHGFDGAARPVLGIVDAHDGVRREFHQPCSTKHSHSLDGRLIVGDGSEALPWILAWRLDDNGLRGPWRICRHDGGWSEQRRHVHPRLAPDSRTVWFTSDRSGAPRLHSVVLPSRIEDLPPAGT